MKAKRINISIDKKTINKLDDYGKKYSLSRSAVIRLVANDFFLKLEGSK